jgi:hypothetical protein
MVNDINHQTLKAGLGIQMGILAISWGDSGLKCCQNEIVYCQLFLVSFFSVLLPLHIQQVADYGLHTTSTTQPALGKLFKFSLGE